MHTEGINDHNHHNQERKLPSHPYQTCILSTRHTYHCQRMTVSINDHNQRNQGQLPSHSYQHSIHPLNSTYARYHCQRMTVYQHNQERQLSSHPYQHSKTCPPPELYIHYISLPSIEQDPIITRLPLVANTNNVRWQV